MKSQRKNTSLIVLTVLLSIPLALAVISFIFLLFFVPTMKHNTTKALSQITEAIKNGEISGDGDKLICYDNAKDVYCYDYILNELKASTPEEVGAIVQVNRENVKAGTYSTSKNVPVETFRETVTVSIVDVQTRATLSSRVFSAELPEEKTVPVGTKNYTFEISPQTESNIPYRVRDMWNEYRQRG